MMQLERINAQRLFMPHVVTSKDFIVSIIKLMSQLLACIGTLQLMSNILPCNIKVLNLESTVRNDPADTLTEDYVA